VIPASLQACGVIFPFAVPTSICRNTLTICSAVCFFPRGISQSAIDVSYTYLQVFGSLPQSGKLLETLII
jgi:hypothetical protein